MEKIVRIIDERAWFIATVSPQEEFNVVDRLAQRGVFAFTPTLEVFRLWTRYDKEKSLRTFAAAPGYVCIGHPPDHSDRKWATVFACEGLRDVFSYRETAVPKAISKRSAKAIVKLSSKAKLFEKFMNSRSEFDVGDVVRVADGPFEGSVSAVEAIHGEEAEIMISIMNSNRRARINLGDLEKVA